MDGVGERKGGREKERRKDGRSKKKEGEEYIYYM